MKMGEIIKKGDNYFYCRFHYMQARLAVHHKHLSDGDQMQNSIKNINRATMKTAQLILLALLQLVVCNVIFSTSARAAAIIYLPADYDGTGAAPYITNTADFAPICNGAGGNPRLPGLNLTRAFAGGQLCPGTTESNRFTTEPIFVLLIDDTSALSPYLTNYLQTQNSLQQVSGRQVVAPSIRTFPVAGQSISMLMVGEMAYRQGGSNPASWFTALNTLPSTTFVTQPPRTLSAYMTECSNATNDVPLPPDWKNDPRANAAGGWEFRGLLSNRLVFAATTAPPAPASGVVTPVTEVWAYRDPKGICMALPRKKGTGINTIELLGIICQSERTGKACFWDNIQRAGVSGGPPAGTRRSDALSNDMKISDIQGGDELRENCTQCHRGDNVFMIHPFTPLALKASPAPGTATFPAPPGLSALDTDPQVRYQPIPSGRMSGQPSEPDTPWENPPATNLTAGACANCHEIPALTKKYCETLFNNSVVNNTIANTEKTMPKRRNFSDPPRDWTTSASFRNSVHEIARKCRDDHSADPAMTIPPSP
ncbi:hypothetical protein NTGM5_770007 [Candidatus Nitrotoga sp. M5]|nr:hypothetical protein NTGM5_770007 [Candidatus Nitrotoga sp. M5]